MNCKPGDLAIIVKESVEAYVNSLKLKFVFKVGTIVKVLKHDSTGSSLAVEGWQIQQKVPMVVCIADTQSDPIEAMTFWCPDEILKPLRDFEDDDSIYFSIDEHQEVTA